MKVFFFKFEEYIIQNRETSVCKIYSVGMNTLTTQTEAVMVATVYAITTNVLQFKL